ncbi:MAG: isocitrate/isopropylmalate family dehydrogenase [Candidatus Altiarchaeota archaeon]
MTSYEIAVIGGDGIGPEIITEGKKVLDAASDKFGFKIKWTDYPFGADHYLATKELVPEEALKEMGKKDAIYLGAIGDDRLTPGILEGGIILATRFYFDQYVNLRPIKLLEGVDTPLKGKGPADIDFVVVRENTEDFYVGLGGRMKKGQAKHALELKRSLYNLKFDLDIEFDGDELAYQIGVNSREGCKRLLEYAFDYAKNHGKTKLTAVDKANVLTNSYGMWREVVEEVSAKYPKIEHEFNFVDAITMWFVRRPEWYQVVATPNMFGDIISDLGAMLQGGLGLAPGGNINPKGVSMFEPIHGSAPKYKGMNTANPVATIWAGAMMLDELGQAEAAKDVVSSIEAYLKKGENLTRDLGGSAKTSDVGDNLVRIIDKQ